MPRKLEAPEFGTYRTICPFCETQGHVMIPVDSGTLTCDTCSRQTEILLARVRGKHTHKDGNYRRYHIRVVTHKGERELSYDDYLLDFDMPMRSSDVIIVIWSEVPKMVLLVDNLTINQYANIYWTLPMFSEAGKKFPSIAGRNKSALAVLKYREDPEFKNYFDGLIHKPLASIL